MSAGSDHERHSRSEGTRATLGTIARGSRHVHGRLVRFALLLALVLALEAVLTCHFLVVSGHALLAGVNGFIGDELLALSMLVFLESRP